MVSRREWSVREGSWSKYELPALCGSCFLLFALDFISSPCLILAQPPFFIWPVWPLQTFSLHAFYMLGNIVLASDSFWIIVTIDIYWSLCLKHLSPNNFSRQDLFQHFFPFLLISSIQNLPKNFDTLETKPSMHELGERYFQLQLMASFPLPSPWYKPLPCPCVSNFSSVTWLYR